MGFEELSTDQISPKHAVETGMIGAPPPKAFIPMLGMGLSSEQDQLQLLAQDIAACERDLRKAATQMVSAAAKAGGLLLEAKKLAGHGEWKKWVEANLPISLRTAQAYMQLHNHLCLADPKEAQRIALLPLNQAIKLLSSKNEEPGRGSQMPDVLTEQPLEEIRIASDFLANNLIPLLSKGKADVDTVRESKRILRKALKAIGSFETAEY